MNDSDKRQEGVEPVELPEADSDQPTPPTPPPGTASYFEKVLAYIPAALNMAYVAALGILSEHGDDPAWLHWAVFLVLWALTPLYVVYMPNTQQNLVESKRFHVLAASIAFPVWCYAINGTALALTFPAFYQPVYGSLLLILTALVLPVIEKICMQVSFFKDK
ncbi:MAG: hypothetical protein KC777_15045 [Cyanobacteria bacterium HKST-UBA02]|nr:hypothetical protein [Cyanobacteria bacterium HKST-UBA02]